ncbi:hypothetical protein AA313_de0203358 [Arthrobotrys entomopaga]|nr:hypothetical protein AA313_de0203358 [Arthrobotrys entomopaga]
MKIAHVILFVGAVSAIPLDARQQIPLNTKPQNGTVASKNDTDIPQKIIENVEGVISKVKAPKIPNVIGSQFFPKTVEEVEKFSGRGQVKTAIWEGMKKYFGGKIDKIKGFLEKLSPKQYKDWLQKLGGALSRTAVGKSFTGVLVTTSQLQATWAQNMMLGYKLRSMNGDPMGHFMYRGMLYRGKWFQRILDRPDNAPGGIEAFRRVAQAKWKKPITREILAQRAWKEDKDGWIGIDGRNFHQIEYVKAGGKDTAEMQNRHKEANKAAQQFVDDRCQGMPRAQAFKKYWAKFHEIYDAHVTVAPGEYWQNYDQIIPVETKETMGKYCGKVDPAMEFPLSSPFSRPMWENDQEPVIEIESKGSSRCEWYWGPLRIFTCDQLRSKN